MFKMSFYIIRGTDKADFTDAMIGKGISIYVIQQLLTKKRFSFMLQNIFLRLKTGLPKSADQLTGWEQRSVLEILIAVSLADLS